MTNQEEASKVIDLAIKQLDREYGEGAVMLLGLGSTQEIQGISTGAFNLDQALGGKGLPRGRVIEVYGPESSGKTTIALTVVGQAQRDGLKCLYVDTEHALDPAYAETLGVNFSDLYLSQPDNAEAALNIVETMARTNQFGVIVVDSVAALVPRAEVEGDIGDTHVGLQARLMSQALRKLTPVVSKSNTMLIFINQLRQKIGVMYGNPEVTSGGKALQFYSSVRIDVRKIENIKEKESGEIGGVRIKAKIVKNKVAPPLRTVEFNIIYAKGVDYENSVVESAISSGIIKKSGSWLSYNGESLAQGAENAAEKLRQDPELLKEIKEQILASKEL